MAITKAKAASLIDVQRAAAAGSLDGLRNLKAQIVADGTISPAEGLQASALGKKVIAELNTQFLDAMNDGPKNDPALQEKVISAGFETGAALLLATSLRAAGKQAAATPQGLSKDEFESAMKKETDRVLDF